MQLQAKPRGQSASEYVILLSLVMAVFLATQTYIKRGVQGVIKGTVDEFGPQASETRVLRKEAGLELSSSKTASLSQSKAVETSVLGGSRELRRPAGDNKVEVNGKSIFLSLQE